MILGIRSEDPSWVAMTLADHITQLPFIQGETRSRLSSLLRQNSMKKSWVLYLCIPTKRMLRVFTRLYSCFVTPDFAWAML